MVIGLKEHVPYYQIFLLFLTISSLNLVNYMCDEFAILSATENNPINQLKPASRNAAKVILPHMMGCCNFTCGNRKVDGQKFVPSYVFVDVIFNDKRKISVRSNSKEG